MGGVNYVHTRKLQQTVCAFAPGRVRACAMASPLGSVFGIETKMDQGIMALAGFHNDVASLAAVAARGPATRNKLLATKREATVAAVAGFDANCGFINEHKN